jgi:hypothetical protein
MANSKMPRAYFQQNKTSHPKWPTFPNLKSGERTRLNILFYYILTIDTSYLIAVQYISSKDLVRSGHMGDEILTPFLTRQIAAHLGTF